jgi:Iron-sulfur cluster assembly accessory protein
MLHITESAAEQLRSLLAGRGLSGDHGLRLSVHKGGCAGLEYGMEIADRQEGDSICGEPDARVFVDGGSLRYLDGCTLDYADDLAGAGFRILNPKAARSCGCGTSFEPAGD